MLFPCMSDRSSAHTKYGIIAYKGDLHYTTIKALKCKVHGPLNAHKVSVIV